MFYLVVDEKKGSPPSKVATENFGHKLIPFFHLLFLFTITYESKNDDQILFVLIHDQKEE